MSNFLAVGPEQLGNELPQVIDCPHCGAKHIIECSSSDPRNKDATITLQFYKCNAKSYLAGIGRREVKR